MSITRDIQGFRVLTINNDLSIVITQSHKTTLIEYQSSFTEFCAINTQKSQEKNVIQTIIDNYLEDFINLSIARLSKEKVRSSRGVLTNGRIKVGINSNSIKLSYLSTEQSFSTVVDFLKALKAIYPKI